MELPSSPESVEAAIDALMLAGWKFSKDLAYGRQDGEFVFHTSVLDDATAPKRYTKRCIQEPWQET